MKHTQFLIFELGQHCNLWNVHKDCPASLGVKRYAGLDTSTALDDETIGRVARSMYQDHGFRGLVGWHYYNEPTLETERMFRLMARIKQATPMARFVLWTNGTRIDDDVLKYGAFSMVNVTDYTPEGYPPQMLDALHVVCPNVRIWSHHHDNRLTGLAGVETTRPCVRPFTEFIIDAFGNTHLCCYDWKGEGTVGNVFTSPLPVIVQRWRAVRDSLAGPSMAADAPAVCRRCTLRTANNTRFVEEVAADANEYIARLRFPVASRARPAVVFVHYNPPGGNLRDERLQEHFRWNDAAYRRVGVRVYVVADRPYNVPDYAVTLTFPWSEFPEVDGRRVFSLAKTKNFGIRCALEDGADPIIVADTDVEFPRDALDDLVAVPPREAMIPTYFMRTWPDREDLTQDHTDVGCTGTVAMWANHWRTIRFDERYVGYGGEDGQLKRDIEAAGIKAIRYGLVWHHAHTPGVNMPRVPGGGAVNCWNREEFNPNMFVMNARATQ